MGASDYMVGNAPGGMSYGAGNMAQQLFQMIGGLPEDYYKGQENQYKLRNQNLFQNGVPTINGQPNGKPDYMAMIRQMIQAGGAPAAQPLMGQLLGAEIGQNAGDAISGGATGPQINPAPVNGAGPANVGGAQPQPQLSSAGTDNSGPATLNSIAAEHHVDPNAFLQAFPGFRGLADRDLTPGQVKAVTSRMTKFAGQDASPVTSSGINQGNEAETVGAGGAPVGAAGGSPISPAPTKAAGASEQPGQSFNSRFGAAPGAPRGTPVGSEGEARTLLDRARNKESLAARYSGVGQKGVADALLQSSKDDRERAKQIFESIGKYNEPTEKEKNVASGAEERSAQNAADVKYYDTLHRGLVGSGMIAAQQKQNIDMLREVASAPSFTPGTGTDAWLHFQRALAQFGINPTGAAPREIFNQLAARILADQFSGIKSLASETGEQGARIFKPMLDIEEKANITAEDSLAGIKAKLDLIDRTGDLMLRWADKADDYKQRHGKLDAGFDKELRGDIAKARVPNVVPKEAPKAPSAPDAGGWRELAPGIRFREKPASGDKA